MPIGSANSVAPKWSIGVRLPARWKNSTTLAFSGSPQLEIARKRMRDERNICSSSAISPRNSVGVVARLVTRYAAESIGSFRRGLALSGYNCPAERQRSEVADKAVAPARDHLWARTRRRPSGRGHTSMYGQIAARKLTAIAPPFGWPVDPDV